MDSFTRWVIDRAGSEVVGVNPYVKECDLSQQLIESRIRGLKVRLVTMFPEEEARRRHAKLKENDVDIHYDKDIHAKVVVVDGAVAVVSSMNFISQSSAGKTWEAGLFRLNGDSMVVKDLERVVRSYARTLADAEDRGNGVAGFVVSDELKNVKPVVASSS